MTPSERLTNASQHLAQAMIRWNQETGANRHKAFHNAIAAAEEYLAERDAFRKWLNELPPPKGVKL